MREMIKMVVVLFLLSSVSAGLLAAVKNGTQEKIDNQVLKNVKGPAISAIMKDASNDPIADRFTITVNGEEKSFFVGVLNGEPAGLAFETSGKGFGGDVGLMVGIDVKNEQLLGVGVTIHAETPGMGALAKDKPDFVSQFKGLPLKDSYKVTGDGGTISAISGATITSRAVSAAATAAVEIYQSNKSELTEKMKASAK